MFVNSKQGRTALTLPLPSTTIVTSTVTAAATDKPFLPSATAVTITSQSSSAIAPSTATAATPATTTTVGPTFVGSALPPVSEATQHSGGIVLPPPIHVPPVSRASLPDMYAPLPSPYPNGGHTPADGKHDNNPHSQASSSGTTTPIVVVSDAKPPLAQQFSFSPQNISNQSGGHQISLSPPRHDHQPTAHSPFNSPNVPSAPASALIVTTLAASSTVTSKSIASSPHIIAVTTVPNTGTPALDLSVDTAKSDAHATAVPSTVPSSAVTAPTAHPLQHSVVHSTSSNSPYPTFAMTTPTATMADSDNNDVLRALVAVFRHADRTPKQKIKVKLSDEEILRYLPTTVGLVGKKECKLKNKHDLKTLLKVIDLLIKRYRSQVAALTKEEKEQRTKEKDKPNVSNDNTASVASAAASSTVQVPAATSPTVAALTGVTTASSEGMPPGTTVLSPLSDKDSTASNVASPTRSKDKEKSSLAKDKEKAEDRLLKLTQIHGVLSKEYGGTKVQIKPAKLSGDGSLVSQVTLICKWGGEMTHAGIGQAKQYAPVFWDDMIPPPLPTLSLRSAKPQSSSQSSVSPPPTTTTTPPPSNVIHPASASAPVSSAGNSSTATVSTLKASAPPSLTSSSSTASETASISAAAVIAAQPTNFDAKIRRGTAPQPSALMTIFSPHPSPAVPLTAPSIAPKFESSTPPPLSIIPPAYQPGSRPDSPSSARPSAATPSGSSASRTLAEIGSLGSPLLPQLPQLWALPTGSNFNRAQSFVSLPHPHSTSNTPNPGSSTLGGGHGHHRHSPSTHIGPGTAIASLAAYDAFGSDLSPNVDLRDRQNLKTSLSTVSLPAVASFGSFTPSIASNSHPQNSDELSARSDVSGSHPVSGPTTPHHVTSGISGLSGSHPPIERAISASVSAASAMTSSLSPASSDGPTCSSSAPSSNTNAETEMDPLSDAAPHPPIYDSNSSLTQTDRAKWTAMIKTVKERKTTEKLKLEKDATAASTTTDGSDKDGAKPLMTAPTLTPMRSASDGSTVSTTKDTILIAHSTVSAVSHHNSHHPNNGHDSDHASGHGEAGAVQPHGPHGSELPSNSEYIGWANVDLDIDVDLERSRMETFRRLRLAFLNGMKVYSSDEARVRASSQAFFVSTLHNAYNITSQNSGSHKAKLLKEEINRLCERDVDSSSGVQTFLSDTTAATDGVKRAKNLIKQLINTKEKFRFTDDNVMIVPGSASAAQSGLIEDKEKERDRLEREEEEREQQLLDEKARTDRRVDEGDGDEEAAIDKAKAMGLPVGRGTAAATTSVAGGNGNGSGSSGGSDESGKKSKEKKEKKKKKKKHKRRSSQPNVAGIVSVNTSGVMPSGNKDGTASTVSTATNTESKKDESAELIVPAAPGAPAPAAAMTDWGVRCLRWLQKPKDTIQRVYSLMKEFQSTIHSICEVEELHEREAHSHSHPTETATAHSHSSEHSKSTHPAPVSALASASSTTSSPAMLSATAPAIASLGSHPPPSLTHVDSKDGSHSHPHSPRTAHTAHTVAASKLAIVGGMAGEDEAQYAFEDGDEEIVGHRFKIAKPKPITTFSHSHLLCQNETLFLMRARWDQLVAGIYDSTNDTFDSTKIPDVYDCIKYDVLHNYSFLAKLETPLRPLYRLITTVADFVIPQEFGVYRTDKLSIATAIAKPLLHRIVDNLESGLQPRPPRRVTLYFSSESHIHALRNVLLLLGCPLNHTVATTLEAMELNYLSHAVLRLYEDRSQPPTSPERFYVNVQFSPGAALDPFIFAEDGHVLPVSRPVPVNGRIPLTVFKSLVQSLS